jgi:phosphoglycerate dehydrogenase-like enzyme
MRTVAFVLILAALAGPARAEMTIERLIADLDLHESPQPVRAMPGYKPPKHIVVATDGPERLAWFQAAAPGVTLVPAADAQAVPSLAKDADAVVGFCTPAIVAAAKKARWIQAGTAGVENCVGTPAIRDGRILLTNMQKVYGPGIAEHVMALMLAATRGIAGYVRAQEREEFSQRAVPIASLWELTDRTLLVVGLGGIGTEVARRAHAFGMKVIAVRNSGKGGPDFVSTVGGPGELPKLVGEADVIVNATPLTPETTGLFNAALFSRMKPTAIFINVGRGESVVQDDLIAALTNKTIGAAALDVMSPEPLPKGHPLWRAPNLIVTPHISGWSDRRQERIWLVMRENLRRYAAGEKLLSLVDPAKGY